MYSWISCNFLIMKYEMHQLYDHFKVLGQAKLIIRFLFKGFQNSMQAGGHFSLFIMTRMLRKQCKKLH